MEKNEFIKSMRALSDEELLEILNVKRNDYVPDAITAVEMVLQERNVNYDKLPEENFVDKVSYMRGNLKAIGSSHETLASVNRIVFVLCLFGYFILLITGISMFDGTEYGKTIGIVCIAASIGYGLMSVLVWAFIRVFCQILGNLEQINQKLDK